MLNHKKATQAAVKEIMVKYSIDVDNLCSFMPQDKVGSFSRYSPKEILQNTLKSVNILTAAEKNLHTEQIELSSMEDDRDKFQRLKDAKEAKCKQLEQEHAAMEAEIEKVKRRENKLLELKYCEIKYIKLELEDCQQQSEY